MEKKNRKKINTHERVCFSHGKHWRMVTAWLRRFLTSGTTVPTKPGGYSTWRFLWGNKVHSFDGVSRPHSRGDATWTKTQVTDTDLDWWRIPALPPPSSVATFSVLSLWLEHVQDCQTDFRTGVTSATTPRFLPFSLMVLQCSYLVGEKSSDESRALLLTCSPFINACRSQRTTFLWQKHVILKLHYVFLGRKL